jgi:hypothetical protein
MGQSIMVAGRFAGHTRKTLEARLRLAGHQVVRDVRHAELLVAGSRPGRALEQAEGAGVPVLGPDMLPSLLASAGPPPEPVRQTSLAEDIHATLGAAPVVESWWRLCRLLDRCTPSQLAEVLPACREAVSVWPAHFRYAPPDWIDALLANGREPRLVLCGCFDFSHSAERLGIEQAVRLMAMAAEHMPLVSALRLNHLKGDAIWQAALGCGHLHHFTALELPYSELGPDKLTQLLEAIDTRTVEAIDLRGCKLGVEGAALLAERDWPRLRWLHLYQNDLTNQGLRLLTTAPGLSGLRALYIGYNDLRGAEAGKLLASATFASFLEGLKLRYNDLGAKGAVALARGRFPELVYLNVGCNEIGDKGMVAIAGATGMPRLARLHDVGNGQQPLLTSVAMKALASSPQRSALRALVVTQNQIDSDGVFDVLSSPHLSGLAELDVDGNNTDLTEERFQAHRPLALRTLRMTASDAKPARLGQALRRVEIFGELDLLDLRLPHNATAAVTCALLANPHISGLVELRISNGPVDVAAAQMLAGMAMPRLRKLFFNDPRLTQAAVDVLALAPWLHQLEDVTIYSVGDGVNLSAVETILKQHGGGFYAS